VVALFNDAGLGNLTLGVRMLYNTFIGVNTNAALVHVSNADGTQMTAEICNNIIYGTRTPVLIESTNAATVTGFNNWILTNASAGPLTNSVRSTTPGFRNLAAQDYTLLSNSPCIDAAGGPVFGLPGKEYFENEQTNRQWRIRGAAHDLGALESTSTNSPIGPYDPIPKPILGSVPAVLNVAFTWPLFAQDFQLYESSALGSSSWSLAPVVYATNFAGITAVVPTGTAAFYRLKK
jgi:hypothetical protein